ncbi:MAG TPA: DUF1385 domain-containing protein, partial [Candidatus Lokiarchaeia archaeon]
MNKIIHGESYSNGIMMNDDKIISLAIIKKDGSIGTTVKKRESLITKHRIFNIFILRGIIRFLEGSTNQFYAEELMKKIDQKEGGIEKHSYSRSLAPAIVLITLIIGIFLYFITPTLISFYLKEVVRSNLVLSGIEIVLRLLIFLIFFSIFSLRERTNGAAMYHGAEHKILWNYRNEEDLTLENTRNYSIRYPSCGTGLMILMII